MELISYCFHSHLGGAFCMYSESAVKSTFQFGNALLGVNVEKSLRDQIIIV